MPPRQCTTTSQRIATAEPSPERLEAHGLGVQRMGLGLDDPQAGIPGRCSGRDVVLPWVKH